ncbi:hypothetical protein NC652_021826 [Populus alba x Populus x berolinensis]|nr:hypothetical protein NC652_021826 [Populus alba x Populus x berolinensis]
MARKQKRKLYPKVKVRTDGQDDQPAHSWSSLLSLKDIQFLCLQDPCFPVKGHQDDSPPPIARIPKSYVPSVIMPKVSVSEGTEKKNIFNEEDKPNIRASSIPRPRAVLSSPDATRISNKRFSNSYPDNDAVIGNNNKTRVARPSALKNNKVIQNRHEQCKVVPCRITDASPTNTRKSKSTPGNKSEVKDIFVSNGSTATSVAILLYCDRNHMKGNLHVIGSLHISLRHLIGHNLPTSACTASPSFHSPISTYFQVIPPLAITEKTTTTTTNFLANFLHHGCLCCCQL